jgi:hypothetical protein
MADAGLFVGWGPVVRGREQRALEVFNEAIQYYTELQHKKEIESFEVALLEQHGGDLAGFILIRGEAERLARLRMDQEFQRRILRAKLIVDKIGVVGALIGGGLTRSMGDYQQEIEKLKTPATV